MALNYRYLRMRLSEAGLLPGSKLAFITWYLLGLDVLLFALQKILAVSKQSYGRSLGGWVGFLSFVVIVLFAYLGARWAKAKMLWRLRNRLIVTYVFIGVIPVVLLVVLTIGSLYLFAGQFATFVVTTRLNSRLGSLDSANSAMAHEVAARIRHGNSAEIGALEGLRQSNNAWAGRHVHVWMDGKQIFSSFPAGVSVSITTCPSFLKTNFREVVRDQDKLFLRAAETIPVNGSKLIVFSSEPVDSRLLQEFANDLGEITLYASGLTLSKVDESQPPPPETSNSDIANSAVLARKAENEYVLDTGKGLSPTYTVGTVPPPANLLDHQVTFATSVRVVNWRTGDTSNPVAISVQTRVSKLYDQLFGAIGDFAPAIETSLFVVAIVFGLIEVMALYIGTRLTRTVTGTVAQLYEATTHINRGDFSHRIPVRSTDQLSTLANSFNSMTTSLEELIEEQKQKQRLENELVIAQEVQEQLYPRTISQLATLEVHGFCRPARTVSGDYYDFVSVSPGKLLVAVGDISGKGISAALLMATIHSAVRAYSLERVPLQQEAMVVGGTPRSSDVSFDTNVSPGTLLAFLNHQLYESTPIEKYATLFLGLYDEQQKKLTYSNGGHLPPIILGESGGLRRLDRGGTVVGLFDHCHYEESSVQLRRGEIFLAYSDGVTEPENEFGEFGEDRLIELVQENRDLPLERITEIVTAAVDDWIGAHEQPDDVTLVLARAR